jgi:hypothetical protein
MPSNPPRLEASSNASVAAAPQTPTSAAQAVAKLPAVRPALFEAFLTEIRLNFILFCNRHN